MHKVDEKSSKEIYVPGMTGDIRVIVCPRVEMLRRNGLKSEKGRVINGLYLGWEATIYIAEEMHPGMRLSVLLHEIHHMVYENTHKIGEEEECNTVPLYYHQLFNSSKFKGAVRAICDYTSPKVRKKK